jgi:hypothetical protein
MWRLAGTVTPGSSRNSLPGEVRYPPIARLLGESSGCPMGGQDMMLEGW